MNNSTSIPKQSDERPGFTGARARDLLSPLAMPRPQRSLRVPVTPANRRYLRALRAAEEAAWERAADRPAQPAPPLTE